MPLTREARAVGRAATLQFDASDHDSAEPYDAAIAFIDALEPGSLVVIATGGSERSAYWGELFSCAAIGRGATGVVCDGYLRDTPKLGRLGFPAFARGTRPIDYRARMEITTTGRPVRCAGVLVDPGELVLADADGVVVVPRAVEADAIRHANDRARRERPFSTSYAPAQPCARSGIATTCCERRTRKNGLGAPQRGGQRRRADP